MVVVLFVVALGLPWVRSIRRLPLRHFLPVVCATIAWLAYEYILRSIVPPGDPVIRVDLFVIIPLAAIAWLVAFTTFALSWRK